MAAVLKLVLASPFATLQDLGRIGYQRYGVSGSGAMDKVSMRAANLLVGNPPGEAAVEFTLTGGEYALEGGACRLAVAGGEFAIAIDGRPAACYRSLTLASGQRLRIGAAADALRGYIAVAGGFAVAPELGSLSTHVRSAIGGLGGRALVAGDALPLAQDRAPDGPDMTLERAALPGRGLPIRVVLGPQDDYFSPAAIRAFLEGEYVITAEADRMGYRLDGPKIPHLGDDNIISDGIVAGSIQVPGNGLPIVLMADCQTTGGYPKIATVISADLPTLAQSRPGARLRFAAVTLAEAQARRAEVEAAMAGLPTHLHPAVIGREALTSEALLSANLISGAWA
ncbi:MAG: biotin-dependent carboxyltransferase family protein [Pseudomonadota bacterium]